MKYLKLYENFNNNIEDTLEDIKWVLVEMTERYELLGHEKDYCMLYEISNMPSEEDMGTFDNNYVFFHRVPHHLTELIS